MSPQTLFQLHLVLAGQLGATYVIPIIYVPVLMITHVVALYWLVRPQPRRLRPSLAMRLHLSSDQPPH
jgi:hypothetical protein